MLTPTQTWEASDVVEPTVLDIGGGTYRMWYRGGWNTGALGTATGSDGLAWTKDAGNPILGGGGGGLAGEVNCPAIIFQGGQFWCFYVDNVAGGTLFVRTSANGVTGWSSPTTVFAPADWYSGGLANVSVVVDGATWRMIFEGWNGSIWRMGYATSSDGLAWTVQAGPLTTLQIGSGSYGGPSLRKTGSTWELWYHASTSSTLPTEIYYATSADLTTWSVAGLVLGRSLSFEVDQVADPYVMTVGATQWMYYAGMNNAAEQGSIGRATKPV